MIVDVWRDGGGVVVVVQAELVTVDSDAGTGADSVLTEPSPAVLDCWRCWWCTCREGRDCSLTWTHSSVRQSKSDSKMG